jgi:hypothetical protein
LIDTLLEEVKETLAATRGLRRFYPAELDTVDWFAYLLVYDRLFGSLWLWYCVNRKFGHPLFSHVRLKIVDWTKEQHRNSSLEHMKRCE